MIDALARAGQYARDGWSDEDAAAAFGVDVDQLRQHLAGAANTTPVPGPNNGAQADHVVSAPAADDGPSGGELAVVATLPEEFWSARPLFATIRQAAHAVGRGADGVLGAVLARSAAMASHELRFDFGLGPGSLNLFVSLVSPSGGGKSSSAAVARRLIRTPAYLTLESFPDGIGIGTGEGLAEIYMGVVERETGEVHKRGPKKNDPVTEKVRTQVRHNSFFFIDEGETLSKMMRERQGTTIGAAIRTAWVGDALGQANARQETTRFVLAGSYSMGMVVGYQPEVAQALLADSGPGTPQRFLWLATVDPSIPDDWPDQPEPVSLPLADAFGRPITGTVSCPPELRAELRRDVTLFNRGKISRSPLDAHVVLMRCKLAALLAVLDDRTRATAEDWELSGTIWAASCAVRDRLVQIGRDRAAQDAQRRRQDYVEREELAQLAREMAPAKVERVARLLATWIHEEGPATVGAARRKLASRDRPLLDAAVNLATSTGLLAQDGTVLMPGDARPA